MSIPIPYQGTCESCFTLPLTKQQELFSLAYVEAIASAAGYGVDEIRVDMGSVDLTVRQYGNGDNFPLRDSLRIQLKCTYAHLPSADGIHYPVPIKNYNDLRRPALDSYILVVLHVPRETAWLIHDGTSLMLYKCAYWISLRNRPAVPNSDTVSVTVPLANAFMPDELRRLMNMVAEGTLL